MYENVVFECEWEDLSSIDFNRKEIMSRCVECFINRGYVNYQSIFENCGQINSDCDDLGLMDADVPFELASAIYQNIKEMRNPTTSNFEVGYVTVGYAITTAHNISLWLYVSIILVYSFVSRNQKKMSLKYIMWESLMRRAPMELKRT